jgi:hypothetical protein
MDSVVLSWLNGSITVEH